MKRRKNRILAEGMRLVGICKVPPFSASLDCDTVVNRQRNWSQQLASALPALLDWSEGHRETLFEEERETIKFRMSFVLVYFEQLSRSVELASFQLNDTDVETRLSWFDEEVEAILVRDKDDSIRNLLFHYFGIRLSLQGWRIHPGELYSFVRMCCFLVEHDTDVEVRFSPKVTAFIEVIGKELLQYRKCLEYQTLGVSLLHAIMPLSHTAKFQSERNANILELALELTRKQRSYIEESLQELWCVIVCCAKPMANPSLDDEIMRTLISNLNQENDLDISTIFLQSLLRLLLFDIPEVDVKGFEVFTIAGRRSFRKETLSYIRRKSTEASRRRNRRFSTPWRSRVGRLMPKLFNRFCSGRNYQARYYLQGLELVTFVVLCPIEHRWKYQRSQGRVLNLMLNELNNVLLGHLLVFRSGGASEDYRQDLRYLHEIFTVLFMSMCDCTVEFMKAVRHESDRVRMVIRSLALLMMKCYLMLDELGERN